MGEVKSTVAAVVVTYNRKELLLECIEALLNQNYNLDEIIVVNNCSTDGTEEMLFSIRDKVTALNLKENMGGAGGFNEGLKLAYNKGHSYFWIMDDDTISHPDSLERLIEGYNKIHHGKAGFVCSNVKWIDGSPCMMNIPLVDTVYNNRLEHNLLKVKTATFVSILITREAVRNCGFPIKEFFIWSDDTEFTERLSRVYENYMVIDSVVTHKMSVNLSADITHDTNLGRLDRYFYAFRNRLYVNRKAGRIRLIKYLIGLAIVISNVLFNSSRYKIKKLKTIIKGTMKGILFNPDIEFPTKDNA
jgi:GT2 family glycosyltransferase